MGILHVCLRSTRKKCNRKGYLPTFWVGMIRFVCFYQARSRLYVGWQVLPQRFVRLPGIRGGIAVESRGASHPGAPWSLYGSEMGYCFITSCQSGASVRCRCRRFNLNTAMLSAMHSSRCHQQEKVDALPVYAGESIAIKSLSPMMGTPNLTALSRLEPPPSPATR